jgi:hypothetical protein
VEGDLLALKAKRDKLKAIQALKDGLPHLYSFPFYKWQREFWDCQSTFQFIFKANQIGGSSISIRKLIHYATEPKLWGRFKKRPTQIIALMPDKNSWTREWEGKWSEFMPRNEFKDHSQYGWHEEWDGKYIHSVTFKTGVTIYFKTYGSGGDHVHTLQSSTPAIVYCDEELPCEGNHNLWPELQMRLASPANAGSMFWMNATPTKGQKLWQQVQSGQAKIPDSWVKTISMYDCLEYEDNSRSIWSVDRIKKIEQTLPSEREIQVRVHGLFRNIDSLAITQFKRDKHVKPFHIINGWEYYAGIDFGVGGKTGHPSAITFVAVSPSYNSARIIKLWRGDGEQTTPDDVISKFLDMKGQLGLTDLSGVYYDHSAGSIGIISERAGLGFMKANKDREYGYNLLNSLFKNDMLIIMDDNSGEPLKLIEEIESLTTDADKKRAHDDLLDSTRYALTSIPFNFENIQVSNEPTKQAIKKFDGRQEIFEETDMFDELGDEIDEWNELY